MRTVATVAARPSLLTLSSTWRTRSGRAFALPTSDLRPRSILDRSVPALLARLEDRRPEVRAAAVRALGDIGSDEAIPALTKAFLERRAAPTNVVAGALRQIGGQSAPAFEQGIRSADPVVRVVSCFGISALAGQHGGAAFTSSGAGRGVAVVRSRGGSIS